MLHIYKPTMITKTWKEANMEELASAGFACFLRETNKEQRQAAHRSKVCSFTVISTDCLPWLLHSEIPSSTVLQIMAAHSCWVSDLGSLISIEPRRSADRREPLQWRTASFGSPRWCLWSLLKCFCMKAEVVGRSKGRRELSQIDVDGIVTSTFTLRQQLLRSAAKAPQNEPDIVSLLNGAEKKLWINPTTARHLSARQDTHTCRRFA